VSLGDLRSAETKGKWWLVGAAWGGDPLLDRRQDLTKQPKGQPEETTLLKLARKQGMNTQVRQSIFMVLMSSDDYVDACNQLSQLNLTEIQQREIIRVLVHCSSNEKAYNPYYTLICQHLCGTSHSHKITLQYCLWDFLRELGENKVGGFEVIKNTDLDDDMGGRKVSLQKQRNLSKAFGWWFAKDSLGIAALKVKLSYFL
jgi:nucleolar MIF4G domain-containing protein 1